MTIEATQLTTADVFGSGVSAVAPFMEYAPTPGTISYFVGRNGSGKSRAAKALSQRHSGSYLATDRLMGIMSVDNYGWGLVPTEYQGPPLSKSERRSIDSSSKQHGVGTEHLLRLRDDPVVGLKVAAFMRKALGRVIVFRENAGFFDPYVRLNGVEYSLLRDEGHGLRELTLLLAAVYSDKWDLLVVDEPELHLHPALAQLWIAELNRECSERSANAIVVTHEPTLLRPKSAEDLRHIWLFGPGRVPSTMLTAVHPGSEDRVTASLLKNPQLVSQLAFAPRPVLVEGPHDVAAFGAALGRTQPPAVTAQTELVACGSSGDAVLWFEIAGKLGLDVRAIADLDALFSADVHRTIERSEPILHALRTELMVEPPRASLAIRPLIEAANAESVEANERARARWVADNLPSGSGLETRRDRLLDMLRGVGLWLHPEGTLEDVLGITKGQADPAAAAQIPGKVDAVVGWCAFDLDPMGELSHLLKAAVERIANNITQALGLDPETVITGPVGPMSESDSQLVDVVAQHDGSYRITVRAPAEFAGYYAEINRDTAPAQILLKTPDQARGEAAA